MKIANNLPKIDNKAPTSHASTSTTYGSGTDIEYGHIKLSDNYTESEGAASAGIGASSKALADCYNEINGNLSRTTYSIEDLTLNTDFSNDTLRFFAIEYRDFVLIAMRIKANVDFNKTAWIDIVSGLPTISMPQAMLVLNTTNQDHGIIKCLYQTDGGIRIQTNTNTNYFLANETLSINGIVMK